MANKGILNFNLSEFTVISFSGKVMREISLSLFKLSRFLALLGVTNNNIVAQPQLTNIDEDN